MRAGDSNVIGKKKGGGHIIISNSLNVANWGVDCLTYSWTIHFHPHALPPQYSFECIYVPAAPPSVPSLSVCLFSHVQQGDGWPKIVASLTFLSGRRETCGGLYCPTPCWVSLHPHHSFLSCSISAFCASSPPNRQS